MIKQISVFTDYVQKHKELWLYSPTAHIFPITGNEIIFVILQYSLPTICSVWIILQEVVYLARATYR